MPRVLCRLPNAAGLISGIVFAPIEDHVISEEIPEEMAAHFLSIPGYELAGNEDQEMADLVTKASLLGLKVDARWKVARLTAEINKAEAAAQAAADALAATNGGKNSLTLTTATGGAGSDSK